MHYTFSRNIHLSKTQHMSVQDITYETLGHTHPVISTASDLGKCSLPKKGMKLERNFSLTLSSIDPDISLQTHKYFALKIIEKPRHGHIRQIQCHIHSLVRRDNSIYLHDSLIDPIKSGLSKSLNNTRQPKSWLVMISWNMGGQQRFIIITQVGLTLR